MGVCNSLIFHDIIHQASAIVLLRYVFFGNWILISQIWAESRLMYFWGLCVDSVWNNDIITLSVYEREWFMNNIIHCILRFYYSWHLTISWDLAKNMNINEICITQIYPEILYPQMAPSNKNGIALKVDILIESQPCLGVSFINNSRLRVTVG